MNLSSVYLRRRYLYRHVCPSLPLCHLTSPPGTCPAGPLSYLYIAESVRTDGYQPECGPIAERRAKTDFTVRTAKLKMTKGCTIPTPADKYTEKPTRRALRRDLPVHPARDDSEALLEGKCLLAGQVMIGGIKYLV